MNLPVTPVPAIQTENELAEYLIRKSYKHIFCISNVRKAKHIKDLLTDTATELTYFHEFSSIPTYEELLLPARLMKPDAYDCILSLGGRGAIDTAKCINAFSAVPEGKKCINTDFMCVSLPLICIPTTLVFGSDVSSSALFMYKGRIKSISAPCLTPQEVFYIPTLYDEMPFEMITKKLLIFQCYAAWTLSAPRPDNQSKNLAQQIFELCSGHTGNFYDLDFLRRLSYLCGCANTLAEAHILDKLSYPLIKKYKISREAALFIVVLSAANVYHIPDISGRQKEPDSQIICEKLDLFKHAVKEEVKDKLYNENDIQTLLSAICPQDQPQISGRLEGMDLKIFYRNMIETWFTVKKTSWKTRIKNLLKKNSVLSHFLKILYLEKKRLLYLKAKYSYMVKPKTILFESYHGSHYNCNPKAIYEELLKDESYKDFRFIWAVYHVASYRFLEKNPRTTVVKVNSKKYLRYCSTSKYWVCNLLMRPWITPKKEQVYIETWHGKPIKKIGCGKIYDTDSRKSQRETFRHFRSHGKRIACLLSPCAYFSPVMAEAFDLKSQKNRKKIYETGYPRNDVLFHYSQADSLRIKAQLEIPPDKTVVLYAPTWRGLFIKDNVEVTPVCQAVNFDELHRQLGENYVLLFRAHHIDAASYDLEQYKDFIIDATQTKDVNDLYMISDILVSDYSGTIFDFAVLKRPMVFYMYDREKYINQLSGVNIDFSDLPGPIVEQRRDLADAIKKTLESFHFDQKYQDFINKYNSLEDGNSARRVLELCIPHEPISCRQTFTVEWFKRHSIILKKVKHFIHKLKYNCNGILLGLGLTRTENEKRLLSFKNKHKGERCFLIGNSPSLLLSDLELLKHETCFACNMIYQLYSKVQWRPTYHCIVDIVYTSSMAQEIADNNFVTLFTHNTAYKAMTVKPQNLVSVNLVSQDKYQVRGNMLAYYVPAKATVMTFMLELAMFMGFKDIYLLGVDNTNSFADGHFSDDYVMPKVDEKNLNRARRTLNKPDLTLFELGEYRRTRAAAAYETIRNYAIMRHINIYNATRGGELEVFKRIELENIERNKGDNT